MKFTKFIFIGVLLLQSKLLFASFATDLTFVPDRLLRGFSLSNEEPSLYAGLHYKHNNTGFYGHMVLFSNIQINGVEELQADIVAGYKFDSAKVTWDVGYVRHAFSKVHDADSGEWFTGAIFKNYSIHYYDNIELNERYFDFNAAYSVGENYDLKIHMGNLDSAVINEKDFTDYSIGVFRDFKLINVGLTYAYNDNKGILETISGSHVVLSLAKTW